MRGSVLALGLLAGVASADMCVMPAFDGQARHCSTDADCCGDNKCVGMVCEAEKTESAVEAAYLAHLVVTNTQHEVVMMTDFLDKAAQGIASASDKISKLAAKAAKAINKDVDKLKEKQAAKNKTVSAVASSDPGAKSDFDEAVDRAKAKGSKVLDDAKGALQNASDSASAKADGAIKSSAPKLKGAAAKADDKIAAAKQSAKKSLEEIRKKFDEIMLNITEKADTARVVEAKAKTGGAATGYTSYFDKFMKGAGGTPDGKDTGKGKKKKAAADDKAGGAAGGFDYQKFVPGSSDKDDAKGKKGGKKGDDAKAGGAAGGFDYQKFVPGGAGGAGGAGGTTDKKTKTKNSAAKDPAAFDYSKFVPAGGKSPAGKGSGKVVNSAAAAGDGKGGAAPFDYSKFMKKVNSAAKDKDPATFDYKKYMGAPAADKKTVNDKAKAKAEADASKKDPKGGAPAFDWKKFAPPMPKNSAAQPAATPYAADPQAGMQPGAAPAPKPGGDGAPCGLTAYKDFGKCKGKLKCVANAFTNYAPGKCEKKGGGKRRVLADASDDADAKAKAKSAGKKLHKMHKSPAGSLGGPCGKWELGHMDFGPCAEGLDCTENAEVQLSFFGKSFGFPSTCKNSTATATADDDDEATTADDDEATTAEDLAEAVEDLAATTFEATAATGAADDDDAADDDVMDKDALKKAASKVAEQANKAALQAADAAEILAKKLLASASKVREAAAKLKEEAANMTTSDVSMVATTSSTSPEASTSHTTLYAIAGLAVAGGAVYALRSKRSDYHRI